MGIKGFARSIALLGLFSSFSAFAGKADDTLVYASDSEPENISPYHNDLREGVILGRLIWDNLVYRNPDNGQYEPMLATSWKQVDDTTIDFQLREGVKFHNGDPFTADDVVFTLNYVVSPESKVVTVQNVDWIKSAEKLGDYSVRLHLKKPFPPALEYLSNAVPMFPKKYFEQVGLAGFSRKPIGTGPYKVIAIATGEGVKMDKNPDYFKDSPQGQPKISHINFRVIADAETRLAELMTGGIDWTWRVAPDQAENLKAMPNLVVTSGATMRIGFLILDARGTSTADSPMKHLKVRQAINHAINREGLASQLVGGESKPLQVACYPGQFGCDTTAATVYNYDPAKAKALLAEAGYPNGFETEIFAYRDRDYVEAIIGNLRAVGINAKLRYLKYAALRDQQRGGKVPMSFQAWGSFSILDTSASAGTWFKGNPDDNIKDPQVQGWLQTADNALDPQVRKDNYRKALQRISEQAYWAPLFNYSMNYAYVSDLNFKPYPDELPRFVLSSWK
ncbi:MULTISPECIES: ABC transporter substrate-binding protein [Pseudomonas]|uniref:ABC transporter substrate-binding protein n=18 Tax=Pseudomonas syringae group TaxID=136849 RepID=A0A0P6W5D0_PSEVI|nr:MULTISPECIES: ABC transporter substrate-binding protein [Pseudomonas]KTC13895.1 ABC transporter substrate-binding protein [Pseudomonas marginalis ICMP 11289]MBD8805205.1 ABC transporter substrate-binding protein [Pseudomonas syringae]VVN14067.1 Heme-binding protein A [Pseudomonas fluorescens]EKN44851.1 peptide ABC transporter periplasmic peptide-binding protein [Pseudomonas viridiflava UASWS0038]KPL61829.1 ABC transporter substrate-binding protein [Pseudomonas viridiflava]